MADNEKEMQKGLPADASAPARKDPSAPPAFAPPAAFAPPPPPKFAPAPPPPRFAPPPPPAPYGQAAQYAPAPQYAPPQYAPPQGPYAPPPQAPAPQYAAPMSINVNNAAKPEQPADGGKVSADDKSIFGLIFALQSIFAAFQNPVIGIVCALFGIILSGVGLKCRKEGVAITGLVLSIIFAIVDVVMMLIFGMAGMAAMMMGFM